MVLDKKVVIYLSLGSNLGDREANLQAVYRELPPAVEVTAYSSIYSTEPWGFRDQPDFLNQVLQAETCLPPRELLVYLKEIEKKIGRKPSFLYGPRLMDIDILLYGDTILRGARLTIPHNKMTERAFVLVPLAEIAPDLIHTESGQTINDLLLLIDTSGVTHYQGNQV